MSDINKQKKLITNSKSNNDVLFQKSHKLSNLDNNTKLSHKDTNKFNYNNNKQKFTNNPANLIKKETFSKPNLNKLSKLNINNNIAINNNELNIININNNTKSKLNQSNIIDKETKIKKKYLMNNDNSFDNETDFIDDSKYDTTNDIKYINKYDSNDFNIIIDDKATTDNVNLNSKEIISNIKEENKEEALIKKLKNNTANKSVFLNLNDNNKAFKLYDIKESDLTIKRKDENDRKILNNYIVLGLLGSGSYSRVKLVLNLEDEINYSMKIIKELMLEKQKKNFSRDKEGNLLVKTMLDDVKNEIEILKRLNHENICKLFEIIKDKENRKTYFIMELAELGPVLTYNDYEEKFVINEYITDGNDYIPEYRIRLILYGIAKALNYLHNVENIVHRDLKPDNILIDEFYVPKLIDFSISSIIEKDDVFIKTEGNNFFYSPELCIGKSEFKAKPCDIWSYGICAYIMIYQKLPIYPKNKHNMIELFDLIRKGEINFPEKDDKNNTISNDLIEFVKRCLEKDPNKRITASELVKHIYFKPISDIDNYNSSNNMFINVPTEIKHNQGSSNKLSINKLKANKSDSYKNLYLSPVTHNNDFKFGVNNSINKNISANSEGIKNIAISSNISSISKTPPKGYFMNEIVRILYIYIYIYKYYYYIIFFIKRMKNFDCLYKYLLLYIFINTYYLFTI